MSKLTKVLGVDPGLTGAFALRDDITGEVEIFDMPVHTITVNSKKKNQIDLHQLANWIDCKRNTIKNAIIENPHAMPGMGAQAMFNFGFNCGVAQAMVASAIIPVTLVRPNRWKKKLNLSKDKDASRLAASQMFPQYSHLWARKKDDGRAEALLLTMVDGLAI